MAYTGVDWQNKPSTASPINRTNLEIMDNGIVEADANATSAKTEVEDVRVGADGVTYSSAGDAVRNQISATNEAVDFLYDEEYADIRGESVYTSGYIITDSTGDLQTTTNNRYYALIPAKSSIADYSGGKLLIRANANYTNWHKVALFTEYNALIGTVIKTTVSGNEYIEIDIPQNAKKITFTVYASSNNNIQNSMNTTFITAKVSENYIPYDKEIAITDTQKEQARSNISAASEADILNTQSQIEAVYEIIFSDILGNSVLTKGYVMNNSGEVSSTENNRYIAAIPGKLDIHECAGSKMRIIAIPDYVSWHKVAFFDVNNTLIGTVIQTTVSGNEIVIINIPQTAYYCNFSLYSFSATEKQDAAISTTKVTAAKDQSQEKTFAISLETPERYELVVGDTFQMFYNGIIKAAKTNLLDLQIICSKGTPYSRMYQFTPKAADVGTKTMTVKLYDTNHELVDTKTVNLVIKAKASSPASEKVVLYVGDSLTSGGHAPGEFKRRLVESNGIPVGDGLSNITFIGSKTNGYVNYEGQGGRSWKSYNEESTTSSVMWITCANHGKTVEDQHSIYKDSNNKEWKLETIEENRIMIIRVSASGTLPETGTLTWVSGGVDTGNIVYTDSEQAPGNPFWNPSANKVDFAYYVANQGKSNLDYVYVLLGWNYFGMSEETLKTNVRTFIDNVLASFPDCKVVILGLEMPSRDGLAVNYGAEDSLLAQYFDNISYVFNLNKWYYEVTQESEYIGKAFYVNVSGQFDTEYNMPSELKAVNTRNSTTIRVQTNGVHPDVPGYYQIADACYRDFVHRLQD